MKFKVTRFKDSNRLLRLLPSVWVMNDDGTTCIVMYGIGRAKRNIEIAIKNYHAKYRLPGIYCRWFKVGLGKYRTLHFGFAYGLWVLPHLEYWRRDHIGGYVEKVVSLKLLKFRIEYSSDKIRRDAR